MYWGVSVKFIVVAVGLIGSFLFGAYVNGNRLEKKHQAEVIALAEKTKAIQNTITAAYVVERNKKDEEIRNLNTRLTTALSGLWDRPSINSSTAGPTLSAKGCHPTELFREYAEFLVKEAARADEIRLNYIELFNNYQNVKKALGQ